MTFHSIKWFYWSLCAFRARICNLGDSGFIHIRNGDIIERSTEQTHYFNCPYQLSIPTPGHNSITDTPDKADLYELSELQPNGQFKKKFFWSLGTFYKNLKKFFEK